MLGNRVIVKILRSEIFEFTTVDTNGNTGEGTTLSFNLTQYGVIDDTKISLKVNNSPYIDFTFNKVSKILTINNLEVGTQYTIQMLFPCYQTGSIIMEGHSFDLTEEYETADTTIFGDRFTREELTIKKTSFTFEAYKENPIVKKMWDIKKPVVIEIYGDLDDEEPEDIVKGYVKKIDKKISVKDVNKITYEFTSSN